MAGIYLSFVIINFFIISAVVYLGNREGEDVTVSSILGFTLIMLFSLFGTCFLLFVIIYEWFDRHKNDIVFKGRKKIIKNE